MNTLFITMNAGTIKKVCFLTNGDHTKRGNTIEKQDGNKSRKYFFIPYSDLIFTVS